MYLYISLTVVVTVSHLREFRKVMNITQVSA